MNKNLKKTILITLYCIVVGTIILVLTVELYLAVSRKFEARSLEGDRNIFLVRPANEGYDESLWEEKWVKYRPNAALRKVIGQEIYEVKINSHGFRTIEFSKKKPRNVFRIICVGGSTTVQGRTNDETYPAILQKRLNEVSSELRFEVLNFGISGTGSNYWVKRIDLLFEFEPDVIIQYNAVNEIVWDYIYRYVKKHPKRVKMNKSFLLQKLFPINVEQFDAYFEETLKNFEAIHSESEKRGVRYIVGSFAAPNYHSASKRFKKFLDINTQTLWGKKLNLKYYSGYYDLLARYNDLFEAYVAEKKINSVMVHKKISEPAYFIDVCHMSPGGVKKLADTFYSPILRTLESRLEKTTDYGKE